MNRIDQFEAYLRDALVKFDPVNVFYGVLIGLLGLFAYAASQVGR